MNVRNAIKVAEKFVGNNSPAILSGVAVSGTLATAFLTGKATFKAAKIIQAEEERLQETYEDAIRPDFDTKNKGLLVWKCYIPPAVAVVSTITCIVTAQTINSSRLAALAAAYKISDKAYSEYKDKVVEQFGEKGDERVRDSVAQDRVNQNPTVGRDIVRTKGGDVLCFDPYSARYFRSDAETLRAAQNDINQSMYRLSDSSSLTDWYERIGLQSTKFSDDVGWNMENGLQLRISTTTSDQMEPCLVIDFGIAPFPLTSGGYPGVH